MREVIQKQVLVMQGVELKLELRKKVQDAVKVLVISTLWIADRERIAVLTCRLAEQIRA